MVNMLSSVLKAQTVLNTITPDNRNKSFWCKLQITYDLLKPVADGFASAESNSTSISIVPEIFDTKDKLKQCGSQLVRELQKK